MKTKKWSTNWTPNSIFTPATHKELAANIDTMEYAAQHSDPSGLEAYFSSFIKPPSEDEAPAPEPEIIFQGHTKEELDEAKQLSYDKGYKTGVDDGTIKGKQERFEVDQQLSHSFSQLSNQLTSIIDRHSKHLKQTEQDTLSLAYKIAQKVAGEALDANAEETIRSLVSNCLGYITTEPHISITVNPNQIEVLKTHLKEHVTQDIIDKNIHIETDDTLTLSDCVIAWKDGGASLNATEKWEQVAKALGQPSPSKQTAKPAKSESPSITDLLKKRAVDTPKTDENEAKTPDDA